MNESVESSLNLRPIGLKCPPARTVSEDSRETRNTITKSTESERLTMVSSQGENTPLLGNNENQNYYFLNGNGRKFSDAGEYVEDLPPGASAEEFAPRVLDATTVVRTVLLLSFGFSTLQQQILFKIIRFVL
jgi:hypothetical protein